MRPWSNRQGSGTGRSHPQQQQHSTKPPCKKGPALPKSPFSPHPFHPMPSPNQHTSPPSQDPSPPSRHPQLPGPFLPDPQTPILMRASAQTSHVRAKAPRPKPPKPAPSQIPKTNWPPNPFSSPQCRAPLHPTRARPTTPPDMRHPTYNICHAPPQPMQPSSSAGDPS